MNGDHDPVEGLLPIRNFYRGMMVADHQRIPVPLHVRPGTYTIQVWYRR